MPEHILKFHRGEVNGVDEEKTTLEAIVSTSQEDRDGDIILPEAFREGLKSYKKHPVLLANHDYRTLHSQIGEAVDITIGDKDVRAKFKYLAGLKNDDGSSMNPQADYAWELAKRGLASYSVGFLGIEWEPISKKQDGQEYITGRKFTKVELMEISQVLIPSNRGALQASAELCEIAIKSFDADKKKVEELSNDDAQKLVDEGKATIPDEAVVEKTEDKKHYSEEILGKVEKSDAEPDKITIDEAVKSTVRQIIGGKQ